MSYYSGARLVALLLTGAVGGCVILPLPPLGAQRGMEEIGSLRAGATREQVREALGDPDLVIAERYEIFDLSEEDLNLLVVPVLPGLGGDFAPVGEARHRVLAAYGPGDVLQTLHWEGLVDERPVTGQAPAPSRETARPAPVEGPRQVSAWELPESWTRSVAAAPFGEALAVTYAVGEAQGRARSLTQVRDGRTGHLLQEIEYGPVGCPLLLAPARGIPDVTEPTAFLSDGAHLVSLAREGVVCVWNLETQRGVHALDAGEGDARRLATARDAPVVASADAAGLVKVWDGISGREIASVAPCSLDPGCDRDGLSLTLALSDDGRLLATSQYGGRGYLGTDYRGAITVWDAMTGDELARFTLPTDGLMLTEQKLAFSVGHGRLAVHLGNHVQVWRLGAREPGTPPDQEIRRSGVPVDLERVLLLPLEAEDPYRERSLGFSGDGIRLVVGTGSVVAWEVGTWRQTWRWVSPSPYSEIGWQVGQGFALRADGETIATVGGVWRPAGPAVSRRDDGSGLR